MIYLMTDPYGGVSFFSFFKVFVSRLPLLLFFKTNHFVSDDIQLIVLALTAISGALVGSFLLLKKMAMFTDALSHTIFLGLVTVFFFTGQVVNLSIAQLTIAAMISAVLTGISIQFLTRTLKVYEEAAIGVTFTVMFALGLLLLSGFSGGIHLGTEFITGNVDALVLTDIQNSFVICIFNLISSLIFFRTYCMVSFDVITSKIRGVPIFFVDSLLILQAALTLIGAFKSVGIVMALAFFIMPGMIARTFVRSVKSMLWIAGIIGVFVTVIAVAISRSLFEFFGFGFSTGGICVVLLSFIYVLALLFFRKIFRFFSFFKTKKHKCSGIDNSSHAL